MVVFFQVLEFQLPGCRSLKEKRQRLGRLRDRFGRQPQVAVTESDHHDNHQRAQWSFVAVGGDARITESLLAQIEQFAASELDAFVTHCHRERLA